MQQQRPQQLCRLRLCAEPCKCKVLLASLIKIFPYNMCFMYMYTHLWSDQVWDKWRVGSALDAMDPLLAELQYPESEVLSCIEIGLLCVQENPAERPDASTVVLMLSDPASMPDDRRIRPSRPSFVFSTESNFPRATGRWSSNGDKHPSTAAVSENEVTITELEPR